MMKYKGLDPRVWKILDIKLALNRIDLIVIENATKCLSSLGPKRRKFPMEVVAFLWTSESFERSSTTRGSSSISVMFRPVNE